MALTEFAQGIDMQDLMTMISAMRRPRMLIRAARIGAQAYRRDRHLRRLVGYGDLPRPAAALLRLHEIEADLDAQRRADDAGYSVARHLDILIAMIGEARMLDATRAAPDVAGST